MTTLFTELLVRSVNAKSILAVLTLLLTIEACSAERAVQPDTPAREQIPTVEANMTELDQAHQKLLANPRDETALSTILTLMRDPNGINRANAAHFLGQVGEKHGDVIKGSAIPALIELFKRDGGTDEYAALKSLRDFGRHAVEAMPIIRKSLQSPDVQNAWIAAETLGRMRSAARDAVPDLVKVIATSKAQCENDDQNICRFAIQALGSIGPDAGDAKADLRALLQGRNPYLRVYAAVALIRIEPKGQEAVAAIAQLLADQDVEVRRRTIWELRDIGNEARPAASHIRTSLHDKDESVRRAAAEIVASFDRD
jgi:HEAT repeat protein